MKRTFLCLIVCLTVFVIILSGCAGENDMQSSEGNNESIQSTENRSETNNSSVMGDSSSVQPSSAPQADKVQTNTPGTSAESTSPEPEIPSAPATSEETEDNMRNIKITVNGETFSATLNDNEAARAFPIMCTAVQFMNIRTLF